MSIEGKITNGHGEFVVYACNIGCSFDDENKFSLIYSVFNRYSPGGILSNDSCDKLELYHDRYNLMSKEIKQIDPNLRISFVPKTLYELVLLRKIIKEDVKSNQCCPGRKRNYQRKIHSVNSEIDRLKATLLKIPDDYAQINDEEKRNRYISEDSSSIETEINECEQQIKKYREEENHLKSKKCWHHVPVKGIGNLEDNQKEKIQKIAFRLNKSFSKICAREGGVFSYETILKLVEKELQFLQKYSSEGREDKNIPAFLKQKDIYLPTRLFRYVDHRAYGKSLTILQEKEQNTFYQVVQQECSPLASKSILLFRAAKSLSSDSTIHQQTHEGMSLSFGTSLLSGVIHDVGANVWNLAKNDKKAVYMIHIPIQKIDSSCVYFPRSNTLCQFFGCGETFHSRTKVPLGQKKIHGVQAGPGSENKGHLYIRSNLEEIENEFKILKSFAIEFKLN